MSELTEPVRMHRVKYSIAFKKNLGNFENTEIMVGLEQDGFGHPDVTFSKVREWVEKNMELATKEVVAALQGE